MKTMSDTSEEMPDNATDRPLVTFALFAYNQEDYIREAVEGAFAQTYEPLEIILSDDCSSDRTFEIMQEMAAAYEGPHEVIARRNEVNYGTAQHVYAVSKVMNGDLIVVAAGDDISLPRRTELLTSAWVSKEKKPSAIYSGAIAFECDDVGSYTNVPLRHNWSNKVDLKWFAKNMTNPIVAPTAAYGRGVFEKFPPLFGGSVIEDGPLCVRSFILGEILPVDEQLVKIRKLPQTAGTGYCIQDPQRWNNFLRSRIISQFNQMSDIVLALDDSNLKAQILKNLNKNIRGLSACVLEPSRNLSKTYKLQIFLRLLLNYPKTSKTILQQLSFASTFCLLLKQRSIEDIKKKIGYSNAKL
jgi:glycosyltransferase involved in cell wall biosynthesis